MKKNRERERRNEREKERERKGKREGVNDTHEKQYTRINSCSNFWGNFPVWRRIPRKKNVFFLLSFSELSQPFWERKIEKEKKQKKRKNRKK